MANLLKYSLIGSIVLYNIKIQPASDTRSETVIAAILGILFGTFLILGVGFTNSDTIHNAAHDTRHSTAFPCH
ncbi:MAG: cobalt transporter [Rhodospirillaceae bacterium]|nr:cobalt transporter [Rhodospirillaceae bacterium]